MLQLRGLGESWEQMDATTNSDFANAMSQVGTNIKTFLTPSSSSVPGAVMTQTQVTPSTTSTAVAPITPTPWYKTPMGLLAIAGSLFVGWKYVLPKLRK